MKVWDKLWRREKGRRETVVCANLKQTSSKRGMTMLQKCHLYKKTYVWVWMFLMFLQMISRHI